MAPKIQRVNLTLVHITFSFVFVYWRRITANQYAVLLLLLLPILYLYFSRLCSIELFGTHTILCYCCWYYKNSASVPELLNMIYLYMKMRFECFVDKRLSHIALIQPSDRQNV